MKKYGVVAIGYNREKSLERLLKTLANADYQGNIVTLIISIDSNQFQKVVEVAENFEWNYGEKIIKISEKKLGLREHVLKCGSYLEEQELDAMAVFEDDIIASPAFFNYMKQAVEFYEDNMDVAGISLYTHLWNVNAGMPFQPAYSGYDNYFVKYAQSWGQIWMKKQWKDFVIWYENHKTGIDNIKKIPQFVLCWPESSWLKYHIAYCVDQNKYFVYPYESLSTCYTDKGEHTLEHSNLFQVPMVMNSNKVYSFSNLDSNAVYYDSFFEREQEIGKVLEIDDERLCVDLYGIKNDYKCDYLLSTQKLDYKIVKSFGLELRPHEQNIIDMIEGEDIFLYDLRHYEKNGNRSEPNKTKYYFRLSYGIRQYIKAIIYETIRKAKK